MEIEKEKLPLETRIAMKFTPAEQNLICIFKKETKYETISAITWTLPYVTDDDMKAVIERTIDKLEQISDDEFILAEFTETVPEIE